jgi:hypothetical protein
MGLEELKQKLEDHFIIGNKKLQIITNKSGVTRLSIPRILVAYYDNTNKIFYGDIFNWWLGRLCKHQFYVPENQITWLLKRLEKSLTINGK